MPSKTKLIEEGKALFAETDERLRGQYERLFGEFRRLLAESEREKASLMQQLNALGKKVEEVQGAVHAERNANRAKDRQLEALQTEIDRLRDAEAKKEQEIIRNGLKLLGGKRINAFDGEILDYVTNSVLDRMIVQAVHDYNQGNRSSGVRGFADKLIVATEFDRRFAIVVSASDVDIFFLDENQPLEWALRDPNLHTQSNRFDMV